MASVSPPAGGELQKVYLFLWPQDNYPREIKRDKCDLPPTCVADMAKRLLHPKRLTRNNI
jgi:hypothetical protein